MSWSLADAQGARPRRSALAYITFAEGIPILYYGTEAKLTGAVAGDANRAVLSQERDLSGLRDTETYLNIKKINWCGLQRF